MIERWFRCPPTFRPGASAVRRYWPKPLSSGLPLVMNFVTFENVQLIAAPPAPRFAYCSGHDFESVSGYVHASAATCSFVARTPAGELTSGLPVFASKKYWFGQAPLT